MNAPARTFELKPAVRGRVPLLLGIVGPSSSGKTWSALELATGIQRVVGGDIAFIDTESNRGLHYADKFTFKHLPLSAPFGPLDYLAAIEFCVKAGAKTLVIDSLTHEHSGEGGVMDQSEKWLDQKCGEDWKKREKMQMLSWVRPKQQRKKLNTAMVQLGINAICCYRADEKIKPVSGGEPLKLGWQPETTSKLHYDMIQRFLLTPGCDGVPSFLPETDAEKRMVKNPAQFRGFFKPGERLSADLGEQLARWAAGDGATTQSATRKAPTVADMIEDYRTCPDRATFEAMETARKACWESLKPDSQKKLKAASDAAFKRIDSRPASEQAGEPSDTEPFGSGDPSAEGDLFANQQTKTH